jgi:N-acetylmuramate 1-kinase
MIIDFNNDIRLQQIREWLKTVLPDDDFSLEIASSDASFRRYFRLFQHGHSRIVMDAPPEHEDSSAFVQIAEFLANFGIHVPHIYARNMKQGFLLLEDLGSTAYLAVLNDETADLLYRMAIDEMINMQLTPAHEIALPDYDEDRLRDEMALFSAWFLDRHLSLSPPQGLDDVFALLIDNAKQQPQYFVHRDYHSRNLMLCPDNRIGVIDFQDAVLGPVTYDLVSLLKDCYIAWSPSQLETWLNYYFEQARNKGLLKDIPFSAFLRWFDLMGLQRHLKVLGIFCRLHYRDGKSGYMHDLPLTLKYVLQVTERYPELDSLHQFLIQSPRIMDIQ